VSSADGTQRLAVLVHEVRSPVAALSALAAAFADGSLESPARLELARLAISACRGIERVVLDAAIASVRLERVDLGALVRQVAAAASLVGARVELSVAADLPRITADPLRLRQALDNLVANALTHADSDEVVNLSATSSGTYVLLSVSDSGFGVPLMEQERIFEAGVRLNPDRAGSGLGLAIARAIAEAHGGKLTLTSIPDKGATFTIALPAC
jgi:two-component system, OmpR family, sensor histidine kinase BaeS